MIREDCNKQSPSVQPNCHAENSLKKTCSQGQDIPKSSSLIRLNKVLKQWKLYFKKQRKLLELDLQIH